MSCGCEKSDELLDSVDYQTVDDITHHLALVLIEPSRKVFHKKVRTNILKGVIIPT